MKKWFILFVILLFFISGCTGATQPTPEPLKPVTIGYIAMSVASPQALISRELQLFENAFTEKGYEITWKLASGRDAVVPMMMAGDFDFLYTPANNFITYFTETSAEFGGGDNYRLIAGSTKRGNNTFLLVNENIASKEDLAGKVVGIANQSYIEEMMLDMQLEKVGLQLGTGANDVRIEYQDRVNLLYDRFESGDFDAIVIRSDLKAATLERFPQSRVLVALNEGEVVGPTLPHTWLYARYDVLQNNPELVQLMLTTHIQATEKATTMKAELPRLALDAMRYHREQILKQENPELDSIEDIENQWRQVNPTYNPNKNFTQMIYDFVVEMGYTDKAFTQFADFAPLNEALATLGLPPLN